MPTDPSSNQPAQGQPAVEPKPISPAIRKRLQRCFERGQELAKQEKADHDYAHTMFSECVLNDPSNLEYVEAMLENLQRKYKNNKRGARIKGFGGRGPLKKAISSEDWDEVFRLGMDLLKTNPWDVVTLRGLANACKANHYNEVELRYLKNALDVNPKDLEVNKHCGESLARMGQFDQAIACWHRIEELDKGNAEAKKKISELTLAKTMGVPPGTDSSESASAARLQSTSSAAATSPSPKEQSTSNGADAASAAKAEEVSIPELEKAIQQDAADLESYVRLAELYTDDHRFREAIQTLKRGQDAAGGRNLRIQQLLEDAQVRMIRAQVSIAEKRAATEGTEEAADLVRRFRAELNRQELMVFNARCERFPDDLALRYELGIRLKREGNYREAIKCFESVRADAERRTASTLEMGECFQHLKQYGNAMKCYQSAASAAPPESDLGKLTLYRAGVLAAALKNVESAEKHLSKLVQVDPHFRDAATRLDKLKKIRDSG